MGVGHDHNRHSQHSHWQVPPSHSPPPQLPSSPLSPSKRKREPVSLLSSLGWQRGLNLQVGRGFSDNPDVPSNKLEVAGGREQRILSVCGRDLILLLYS